MPGEVTVVWLIWFLLCWKQGSLKKIVSILICQLSPLTSKRFDQVLHTIGCAKFLRFQSSYLLKGTPFDLKCSPWSKMFDMLWGPQISEKLKLPGVGPKICHSRLKFWYLMPRKRRRRQLCALGSRCFRRLWLRHGSDTSMAVQCCPCNTLNSRPKEPCPLPAAAQWAPLPIWIYSNRFWGNPVLPWTQLPLSLLMAQCPQPSHHWKVSSEGRRYGMDMVDSESWHMLAKQQCMI